MKKFVILALLISSSAWASARTPFNSKNLEAWCAHTDRVEKRRFPYMAAIYNIKSRHGMMKVATVFKHGKIISKQLVQKTGDASHLSYKASSDFSLVITSSQRPPSKGDFRAIVRDEDGDKLIGTASIQCVVVNKAKSS